MKTVMLNGGQVVAAIETGQYAGYARIYGNRAMAQKVVDKLTREGVKATLMQAVSPSCGFYVRIEVAESVA